MLFRLIVILLSKETKAKAASFGPSKGLNKWLIFTKPIIKLISSKRVVFTLFKGLLQNLRLSINLHETSWLVDLLLKLSKACMWLKLTYHGLGRSGWNEKTCFLSSVTRGVKRESFFISNNMTGKEEQSGTRRKRDGYKSPSKDGSRRSPCSPETKRQTENQASMSDLHKATWVQQVPSTYKILHLQLYERHY